MVVVVDQEGEEQQQQLESLQVESRLGLLLVSHLFSEFFQCCTRLTIPLCLSSLHDRYFTRPERCCVS